MKKLACLVSALTLLGFASSGYARPDGTIPQIGTIHPDAQVFTIQQVHDVTDYYPAPTEGVGGYEFDQYLAQDPGGKIRGVAYLTLDDGGDVIFSITGSISGGPSTAGKVATVKLTYKAISSTINGTSLEDPCGVGECTVVAASGSLKGVYTVTTCTTVQNPCEEPGAESDFVRLNGTLSGTIKVGSTSLKFSQAVQFEGASVRAVRCVAYLAIDVYPTSIKRTCDELISMKFNAIGYVQFDSEIRDIVTGSGSYDAAKGYSFSVSSCYGKLTVTTVTTADPCDECAYTYYYRVKGKIGGQSVDWSQQVDDFTDPLFWDYLVYHPNVLEDAGVGYAE